MTYRTYITIGICPRNLTKIKQIAAFPADSFMLLNEKKQGMVFSYESLPCLVLIKQGAKLQQARLIGASDAVNRRRGALAPAGVGGGF